VNPEEKIDEFVKMQMSAQNAGAHAYDHVKRVYLIALKIGKELGADLRILKAAALLHDVGRFREEETGVSHSILSGEMSEEILREVGYDANEIERVKSAIRTHRFSEGLTPDSLEGEILSDADKLDAIGAVGVFRSIAQAAVKDAGIDGFLRHADEKLLKLHELMYTERAKEMAQKRFMILNAFVSELRNDVQDIGLG
jgi:uncharacterized protein